MKSVLVLLAVVACVFAHGGIDYPPARIECSANVTDPLTACGQTVGPCGSGAKPTTPTVFAPGTEIDLVFFQLVSHYDPENTVTFNLLNRDGSFIAQIEAEYQNVTENGVYITYPFPVPAGLSGDAVIQSIFNATAGGGDVYYSCADIAVQAATATTGTTTGAASSVFASVALIATALFALL